MLTANEIRENATQYGTSWKDLDDEGKRQVIAILAEELETEYQGEPRQVICQAQAEFHEAAEEAMR